MFKILNCWSLYCCCSRCKNILAVVTFSPDAQSLSCACHSFFYHSPCLSPCNHPCCSVHVKVVKCTASKILSLSHTWMFVTACTQDHLCWAKPPSHLMIVRSILMLFSHLCPSLPTWLPFWFSNRNLVCSSHCMSPAWAAHLTILDLKKMMILCSEVYKFWSFLFRVFLHPACTLEYTVLIFLQLCSSLWDTNLHTHIEQ